MSLHDVSDLLFTKSMLLQTWSVAMIIVDAATLRVQIEADLAEAQARLAAARVQLVAS
jgi:hypothetical protein